MTLYSATNLAAFSSACPLFVALLRGGAIPTNPNRPRRNATSGTGFLLSKMKEYDA
jgi:hypothetical protein